VNDVLVALLALAAGALFCFRGYLAMRIVIPIWGGFAGFMLGAGIVATGDDGFLRTGLAWIVGIAVGLLFAALAYLYYEVSVVIGMAAIGFALGSSLMVALGVDWNWVIVLVGLLVAVLLTAVALMGDLPMMILVLLSAMAGASAIVFGIMLLVGTLQSSELEQGSVTERLGDDWWWFAIYLGLVVAGVIAQVSATDRIRASMRESWSASGGKQMRSASTEPT
jgi:Domain of unknown function (DUF4203)